mgnify:CR=1 FL=1|jgi:hypothetical protein
MNAVNPLSSSIFRLSLFGSAALISFNFNDFTGEYRFSGTFISLKWAITFYNIIDFVNSGTRESIHFRYNIDCRFYLLSLYRTLKIANFYI